MTVYINYLRAANTKESKDPKLTIENLEHCLDILESDSNLRESRKYDEPILISRIKHLKKRLDLSEDERVSSSKPIEVEEQPSSEPVVEGGEVQPSSEPVVEEVIVVPTIEKLELKDGKLPGIQLISNDIPPIVQKILNMMINKQTPSYEQYLEFYTVLNELLPQSCAPFLQFNSDLSYYIGDTHGSYQESLIMVNYFNKVIQKCNDAGKDIKVVFVGDYVDRNPMDLENLTLLMAFHIINKDKVVLLRGNHEDFIINKRYGFIDNLRDRFGVGLQSKELYDEILKIFVRLPISLINSMESKNIFCTHGGIPVYKDDLGTAVNLLDIYDEIGCFVEKYEDFDFYTNWLLWADPKEDVFGIVDDPSTGRSQFGESAFTRFMEENKCDFMVRAHEKWREGYKYFFNDKLISLFSTSFYNNQKIGDAAFIRIVNGNDPVILSPLTDVLEEDLNYLNF